MGAKSTALAEQVLALLLNGTGVPGLADNTATAPLAQLYLALHTASPGVGGNQSTSEALYPGYARVSLPRTSAGFTVSGGTATLTSTTIFPTATGGSETEQFFSLGEASTGAGEILYFGPLNPPISIFAGITPVLTVSTVITET